jgi:transposase
MIDLSHIEHIYLYPGMTDMRLGIYGLRTKILESSELTPASLYIFCGKAKNQLKIIEVTNTMVWLYQSKMVKGKFIWPDIGSKTDITKEQLNVIIEGMSLINSIEHKNKTFSIY